MVCTVTSTSFCLRGVVGLDPDFVETVPVLQSPDCILVTPPAKHPPCFQLYLAFGFISSITAVSCRTAS